MRNLSSIILLIFVLLLQTGCSKNNKSFPSVNDLFIKWELIANDYLGKGMFKSVIHLTNNSKDVILPNKGWELYFNFTASRKICLDSVPSAVKLVHINGDFFKIIPTEKFTPLNPGETFSLPLVSNYLALKYSDAPGGFYFVFEEEPGKRSWPRIVENYSVAPIKSDQLKRNKDDQLSVPTPLSRYGENVKLSDISAKEIPLIIPTPFQLSQFSDSVLINPSFEIYYEKGLLSEAEYLKEAFLTLFKKELKITEGIKSGMEKSIILRKASLSFSNSPEAYQLSVSNDKGIEISGNSSAGVFYGIQSLRALLPIEAYSGSLSSFSIPECMVKDYPQFPYRGMLLDVVRHFHSKQSIMKLLDLFSFYKINKIHFHLTDDEGWRIEIKGLPELTEVGSRRGHTLTEEEMLIPSYGDGPFGQKLTSGFYSREDFIEILKYAHRRHIEIIPEFDLPGHARAAIKAMDVRYKRFIAKGDTNEARKYLLRDLQDSSQYFSVQGFTDNVICPCQEGVYNFAQTVSNEFISMYQEAGVPLETIHLGGDEVADGAWEKSPACSSFKSENKVMPVHEIKEYFMKRVHDIIDSEKLLSAVVEDAMIYRIKDGANSELKIHNGFSDSKIKVYTWCNVWGWGLDDLSYKLANQGFPVVLCPVTNVYFDLAYTNEAEEPGLYWGGFNDTRKAYEYIPLNAFNSTFYDINGNPVDENLFKDKVKLTNNGKKNILGIQGMLFSETLKDQGMVEYYTFPKLIGLAERAWSKQPEWATINNREKRLTSLERAWNVFANAIGKRELPRLDYLSGGVNYRLPPPGVVVEKDILKVNSCFPGLMIRYTTDGSEPTVNSPVYNGPVKVSGNVKVCTFNTFGRKSRVSAVAVQQFIGE